MRLQRIARWFRMRHIRIIPGVITKYIHFRYNCDIQPTTEIGRGTTLGHSGIGVVINSKAKIGRNCILAQNVTLAGKDGRVPVLNDWCYSGANSVINRGGNIR